jgi:carboxymethylenebutenolidase
MIRRLIPVSIAIAGIAVAMTHRTSVVAAAADDHASHMAPADLNAPAYAATVSQGMAGFPPSNNAAPARLAASRNHAEWVMIPWGDGKTDSLAAWIVYPPTANAKSPVIVVVHEIFGLTAWVRSVADQAANDGFIAIAPDLMSRVRGGASFDSIRSDSATRIQRGVPAADKAAGIIASARYAMSQPSAAQKYGVIGYCWGGSSVFIHAVHGGTAGYGGGVAFYGAPYTSAPPAAAGGAPAGGPPTPASPNADSLKKINKPIMLLNGSKDARIGAMMPAIDSIMKSAGKDYVGINYEGAVHGFLRAQDDHKATPDPVEEAANVAATKDAWPRMLAFMRKNLK